MLKAAAERLRLRAAEKISADCSTANLIVPRGDLTTVLNALDLAEDVMPAAIISAARTLRSNVREARYALNAVDAARMDTSGNPSRDLVRSAQKWSERTVDAATALVEAVLGYEHTGDGGASSDVSTDAAQETTMTDQTAGGTQAAGDNEDNQRAQRAADRLVAARVELAAAIDFANAERADIDTDSKAAIAFLDATLNPSVPNPPPVAPDVAAPPPADEPPVFTTVDEPAITPENTSGGFAPDIAASMPVEGFEEVATDPAMPDAPPAGDTGSGPA